MALVQAGCTVGAEVFIGACALAAAALIAGLRRVQQPAPPREPPAVPPRSVRRVDIERSARQEDR